MRWTQFLLLVAITSPTTFGYKILGIFHTTGKSHAIVGQSLMKGLAGVGHDVTMLSPFPLTNPMENYRDLEVTGVFDLIEGISLTTQIIIEILFRNYVFLQN